jgi:hypothetical protein
MAKIVQNAAQAVQTTDQYDLLEILIRRRVAEARGPIFTTDVENLFFRGHFGSKIELGTFLNALPEGRRQHYTCHACRRFFDAYAGLATINGRGEQESLIFHNDQTEYDPSVFVSPAPRFFLQAWAACEARVRKAKVTGVFQSDQSVWGFPETCVRGQAKDGETGVVLYKWSHLSGVPDKSIVFSGKSAGGKFCTAEAAMAEKVEERGMLMRAIAGTSEQHVQQALQILQHDDALRGEKATACGEWFLNLLRTHSDKSRDKRTRENLIWLAVATGPSAWMHVGNSVFGQLVQSLSEGLPAEAAINRWKQMNRPDLYQRPQALPSEGTIRQAEQLVEQMGCADSLRRRYARLEDVLKVVATPFWLPRSAAVEAVEEKKAGGVFDCLKPKSAADSGIDLPTVTVTWEKFRKVALEEAREIEVYTPYHGPYYCMLCAEVPESPPILQWDGLTDVRRNHFSWYLRARSPGVAAEFNLRACEWVRVRAILPQANSWQRPDLFTHLGEGAYFVLEGARETRETGACLFPQIMRKEMYGVRAVLEAYSEKSQPAGREEGDANGICFQKGGAKWEILVRVRTEAGTAKYKIDRWD